MISDRDSSEDRAKAELILDNMLHSGEEAEDALLASASDILRSLVAQARQEQFSSDWERELYEL